MVDFFAMPESFVVTFSGEGAACHVVPSAAEVLRLLMHEEGGGLSINSEEIEVCEWLEDDDNWAFDDGDRPFMWCFDIGEMSSVSITRISPSPLLGIALKPSGQEQVEGQPCWFVEHRPQDKFAEGWWANAICRSVGEWVTADPNKAERFDKPAAEAVAAALSYFPTPFRWSKWVATEHVFCGPGG